MSNAIAVRHGEFGRAALYSLDKSIINHAHREGHLIFCIDGDDAHMTISDVRQDMPNGNAVAISPWEPHNYEIAEGKNQVHLVLYIKPMWFLENSSSAEFAMKFGKTDIQVTDEIAKLISRLTALLLENDEDLPFDQLLFGLTKASFDQSWSSSKDTIAKRTYGRFNDFRVRRSLKVIRDRMGEDVEMEQLARSVGLSRPHFFKLFKQYMGVTPNVYMNTLRSERAIEELLHTEKTVTDIAFDLGFSSQASFTRFFSSNVGIAPSEYRRVAHVTDGAFPMM